MSGRTSLAEFLRVLPSYWYAHDYCASVKYSRAFVYVAVWHERTSALAKSANVRHGIATYASVNEFIFITIIPLLIGLLLKLSIYFTKIMQQSSRRFRKMNFPLGQPRAAVKGDPVKWKSGITE